MIYAKLLAVNILFHRSLFSAEVVNGCLQDINSTYVYNSIYDNTINNEKSVNNYLFIMRYMLIYIH